MKFNLFKNRNNLPGKSFLKRSYLEFLVLIPHCCPQHYGELTDMLQKCKSPKYIKGMEIPQNLNGLNYGQLVDLSQTGDDPITTIFEVVLGFPKEKVYGLSTGEVFGFCNMVTAELRRINGLFESTQLEHTSEEIAAGIEQLNFGSFGVLDWYARRMRITNQNEVRCIPWIRIYMCMKNDAAQVDFERRYHKEVVRRNKLR